MQKRAIKLFKGAIGQKAWKLYDRTGAAREYRKGESILLLDEVPKNVYRIETGIVRVYNITPEGEERTVSFDVSGEIFPIGWVLGKINKTQYFYQALTDCKISLLDRNDLIRYLRFHPKAAYMFYGSNADRYMSLQKRIYALTQTKASDKILYTLAYLAEKFGENIDRDKTQIQIPLTQQELANFIGLTRETTSTELKKLEKEKIVKRDHLTYTIDTKKLAEITEEL